MTPEAIDSIPLFISLLSNKKSLNLTSMSPRLAVKSRTFISNAPKIAVNPLNASFKPPPAIVDTISNKANKPLKVRLNLSTSSPANFIVCVNL